MNFEDEYLQKFAEKRDEIQGWTELGVLKVLEIIEASKINQAAAGVMEIGVHHGALYIPMNSFTNSNSDNTTAFKSLALDIFDDQELNIDNSGSGSYEVFTEKLKFYDKYQGKNTIILKGDSTDSSIQRKLKKTFDEHTPNGFKFISVDGGHTPEHTINDIKLANEYISSSGVVLVDDILNYYWLGVIEGVSTYLKTQPTLVPFAIGFNKLFMCKLSYHKKYYELMQRTDLARKTQKFFGYEIVNLST